MCDKVLLINLIVYSADWTRRFKFIKTTFSGKAIQRCTRTNNGLLLSSSNMEHCSTCSLACLRVWIPVMLLLLCCPGRARQKWSTHFGNLELLVWARHWGEVTSEASILQYRAAWKKSYDKTMLASMAESSEERTTGRPFIMTAGGCIGMNEFKR